jgi:selenocysteine lyase/cysteine desulfurase
VDFYQNHNANTGRAVHTLSQEATDTQKEARAAFASAIQVAVFSTCKFLPVQHV